MNAFAQYRRKQIAELRPWQPGYNMNEVSVSLEDARAGSPKAGDMIARNPKNHADQWLVSAVYFAGNFEPVTSLEGDVIERVARIIDPSAWRDQGYKHAEWRIQQSLIKARAILATLEGNN